jgi:hypothetical protein
MEMLDECCSSWPDIVCFRKPAMYCEKEDKAIKMG